MTRCPRANCKGTIVSYGSEELRCNLCARPYEQPRLTRGHMRRIGIVSLGMRKETVGKGRENGGLHQAGFRLSGKYSDRKGL